MRPSEGMVVKMHHPAESPLVGNAEMTVSQHADSIFEHFKA